MDDQTPLADSDHLRKWLHDVGNRVGAILAMSELLQLDSLTPQAEKRRQTIEDKALEVRDLLRAMSARHFP
jgi:hypothetical protein